MREILLWVELALLRALMLALLPLFWLVGWLSHWLGNGVDSVEIELLLARGRKARVRR